MDILIIGVSNIFLRKVLPALLSLNCVEKIHIASKRKKACLDIPKSRLGQFYSSYEEALQRHPACLAYISLPNNLHAEWVRKALLAGFHVVVDKPAFLRWDETQSLLALAQEKNLCLAESNVWGFHPQVTALVEAFDAAGIEPTAMQAVFTFPPLSENNFRNNLDMGGGSFLDLGRYAVSPGRIFFRDDPIHVSSTILSRNQSAVDVAFILSAIYPRGRSFQGFFSFTTQYKNKLSLLGDGLSVELEPAFTFSDSNKNEVHGIWGSQPQKLFFTPGDSFAIFFKSVIYSIETKNWMGWWGLLERDAYVIKLAIDSMNGRQCDH